MQEGCLQSIRWSSKLFHLIRSYPLIFAVNLLFLRVYFDPSTMMKWFWWFVTYFQAFYYVHISMHRDLGWRFLSTEEDHLDSSLFFTLLQWRKKNQMRPDRSDFCDRCEEESPLSSIESNELTRKRKRKCNAIKRKSMDSMSNDIHHLNLNPNQNERLDYFFFNGRLIKPVTWRVPMFSLNFSKNVASLFFFYWREENALTDLFFMIQSIIWHLSKDISLEIDVRRHQLHESNVINDEMHRCTQIFHIEFSSSFIDWQWRTLFLSGRWKRDVQPTPSFFSSSLSRDPFTHRSSPNGSRERYRARKLIDANTFSHSICSDRWMKCLVIDEQRGHQYSHLVVFSLKENIFLQPTHHPSEKRQFFDSLPICWFRIFSWLINNSC